MNVVVNGLMANYQKFGQGKKTLVFLHGWADSSKTFAPIIKNLQNDYSILALDLPGFGGSQRPSEAWNTDDFSKFVAAWLDKIGVNSVYAFLAHSFGAATVINGLANGDLKSEKLVLIAAAGIRNKGNSKKMVLKIFAKTAKVGLYLTPRRFRQKLRTRVYGKLGSDMLSLAEMEPSFRKIIGEDMQTQASKLSLQTLLIFGASDDQTPPGDGKIFNRLIKDSRLKIIDGAGHFVHQEQSEKVAGIIEDFLKDKQ